MIGSLTGKPVLLGQDKLIIDVQGVGYEVRPTASLCSVAKGADNLHLVIHTEVKENEITLYGFANEVEKEVFSLLKKVKGIGPKLASTAVSSVGAESILRAISTGEYLVFKNVPGVGEKTAKRIILELGEQVATLAKEEDPTFSDACLALEKLGFDKSRAEKAVKSVYATDKPTGQVLKEALRKI